MIFQGNVLPVAAGFTAEEGGRSTGADLWLGSESTATAVPAGCAEREAGAAEAGEEAGCHEEFEDDALDAERSDDIRPDSESRFSRCKSARKSEACW